MISLRYHNDTCRLNEPFALKDCTLRNCTFGACCDAHSVSEMGQIRRFDDAGGMSAAPQIATECRSADSGASGRVLPSTTPLGDRDNTVWG